MKARQSLYLVFLAILLQGCQVFINNETYNQNEGIPENEFQKQSLLGILYTQTSTEFVANNIQTFISATSQLDQAIADTSWKAALEQTDNYQKKPPAVILDIDETVLDNTAFQARTILTGESYPNGWIDWGNEAKAPAVAGVKDFLLEAQSKGVKIFYVTNRVAELEEATRINMVELGLPLDTDRDVLMMKGESGWGSDKTQRRSLIAKDYRIIMMFGDQLNDFLSRSETAIKPDKRKSLAYKYKDMWGSKWFMITNPMYGGWEAAIYDFEYPSDEEIASEIRIKNLKP
jgi:acid phosphatase